MFAWVRRLDHYFPVRYWIWALSVVGLVVTTFAWAKMGMDKSLAIGFFVLAAIGVRDLIQQRHAVLRNYPLIGHIRFLLEFQAQTCHTGNCPTGVTTQDPHRQKALVVASKADRVYHFHENTLLALKEPVQAAGLAHPRDITASHIVRRTSDHGVKLLANLLPFVQPGSLLRGEMPHQVFRAYWPLANATSFAAVAPPPGEPALIVSAANDLVVSAR